jgi:hypothetical protein
MIRKIDIPAAVVAILFSAFTLIGYIFHKGGFYDVDSWDYIFHSRGDFAGMVASFLGQAVLYYIIVRTLFRILDTKLQPSYEINRERQFPVVEKTGMLLIERIGNHPFLFALSVIFLCWLPYLIIQYPGSCQCCSQ